VSDSNKFVLIRSEARGSVGKQLVLPTASTYQLLVIAPCWLHWDWLLKGWGCTATTRQTRTQGGCRGCIPPLDLKRCWHDT